MALKISQTLGIHVGRVSVKAKTSGKMGFVGRGEGMAAYAVALIEAN
jgi:2-C-methyl-D-erythritol 2,4-cyclodiphosphate synthase